MSRSNTEQLIDLLVIGDISRVDHEVLQQTLKADANARALFRERMDLEAGLRTWASAPTQPHDGPPQASRKEANLLGRHTHSRIIYAAIAIAASVCLIVGVQIWNAYTDNDNPRIAGDSIPDNSPGRPLYVGHIRQQSDCEWAAEPIDNSRRFATGKLYLTNGIAELVFDSGTEVTMEAPCEIAVTSLDTAQLLAGTAFVNVTELSNGFTLGTPESQIVDEGTEYAVSIGDEATEVHVFDGSVIWISSDGDVRIEDRIASGEAKSYLRSDPTNAKRIPFGQRQFVRRIEDQVKQQAGNSLLAYDGFENLAGRVRRGRSGFGWSGGWESGGRVRGKLADIIETPDDVVFGQSRKERRQMLLENGCDIRREFEAPLRIQLADEIYISILIQRQSTQNAYEGQSLQISLEPDLPGRGRRLHKIVSFGFTTDGFPFINSGTTITKTASRIGVDKMSFIVLKLAIADGETIPSLRVFQFGEVVDGDEPTSWTVLGRPASATRSPISIRVISGENACWVIDELKIGRSWDSVTRDHQAASNLD